MSGWVLKGEAGKSLLSGRRTTFGEAGRSQSAGQSEEPGSSTVM